MVCFWFLFKRFLYSCFIAPAIRPDSAVCWAINLQLEEQVGCTASFFPLVLVKFNHCIDTSTDDFVSIPCCTGLAARAIDSTSWSAQVKGIQNDTPTAQAPDVSLKRRCQTQVSVMTAQLIVLLQHTPL